MRWMAFGACVLLACGDSSSSSSPSADGGTSGDGSSTPVGNPPGGPAGNPDGKGTVPAAAQPEDVSQPTTVVGTGTQDSCTADAFVRAVAKGGVVTFDCGADPVTITLTQTAKIKNGAADKTVIDGGGKIAISGGGKVRILYQNTCDPALGSAGTCDTQKPLLALQNITLMDGNSTGQKIIYDEAGGGAVYVRGGTVKINNVQFLRNVCEDLHSDWGGGALRVSDYGKPEDSSARPAYVVQSTFADNHCANGGAISSIGTSYTFINSVFHGNQAVGHGANDGQGGNGGAIYNDGNTYTLTLVGTLMENNHANEGGSAVFYVSNDDTGSLVIKDSTFRDNPKGTFETENYPGFFIKTKSGEPEVENSTFTR